MAHFTRSFLPPLNTESDPTTPAHVKAIPPTTGQSGKALVATPTGWAWADVPATLAIGQGLTRDSSTVNLGGSFSANVNLQGQGEAFFRASTASSGQNINSLEMQPSGVRLVSQLFNGTQRRELHMPNGEAFTLLTGGLRFAGPVPITNARDVVDKAYADNVGALAKAGLAWKEPVLAASTAQQALTGISLPVLIDGVEIPVNARVLLLNQTNPAQNGIYILTVGMGVSFQRAADANGTATGPLPPNTFVFVQQGTQNADKAFILITDGPINVGTTAQTWQPYGVSVTVGEIDPSVPIWVKGIPEPPNTPRLLSWSGLEWQYMQEEDPSLPGWIKDVAAPLVADSVLVYNGESVVWGQVPLPSALVQEIDNGGFSAEAPSPILLNGVQFLTGRIFILLGNGYFDFSPGADGNLASAGLEVFFCRIDNAIAFVNGILIDDLVLKFVYTGQDTGGFVGVPGTGGAVPAWVLDATPATNDQGVLKRLPDGDFAWDASPENTYGGSNRQVIQAGVGGANSGSALLIDPGSANFSGQVEVIFVLTSGYYTFPEAGGAVNDFQSVAGGSKVFFCNQAPGSSSVFLNGIEIPHYRALQKVFVGPGQLFYVNG
jgi:hypothetical protein